MLRIGLTGGIASGKTTVSDLFASYGVPVIDTDIVARDVVRPGMPALNAIRDRFGSSVITDDGTLDRTALRKIVFDDGDSREALEAILHPTIQEETIRRASVSGGPYQVIVVPLLVESALKSFVDRILVVDCSPRTQLDRLLSRDAENVQQAERMIAAQSTREERLAIADDVIVNDGELEETRRQVASLHLDYLKLAAVAAD